MPISAIIQTIRTSTALKRFENSVRIRMRYTAPRPATSMANAFQKALKGKK